MSGNA